jgi:hypothetical protein
VIRLITPPFPAVSRPSKTTMTRAPVAFTQVLETGKLDLELRELLLEFFALDLAGCGIGLSHVVFSAACLLPSATLLALPEAHSLATAI